MLDNTLLRLPDVLRETALSRSGLYYYIKLGRFPAPVRIGRRAVRWRRDDIAAWLQALQPAHGQSAKAVTP